MQTLFRATVMIVSLGAGVWALVEYGPEETVQPIARRAIELADDWIGRAEANLAQDSHVPDSPDELPMTRLVAEPGPRDLTAITAPALAPRDASPDLQATAEAITPLQGDVQTRPDTGDGSTILAPLTRLGVQNLQLSQWGREGRLHRVTGEMAIGQGSGIVRHVEAVAEHPEAAVAEMERQVLAWRMRDQHVARLR